MLFSTNIFIYVFLPLCIAIYFIWLKFSKGIRTISNYILLVFSIVFFSMGGGKQILILLASVFGNYIFAIEIERRDKKKKRPILYFALFFNIGLLIWFKYFNFICENIINLVSYITGKSYEAPFSIVLPIGISFFTFQAMSYVIDVSYGRISAQKNFCKLALYICFFPQIIAGPIVRYGEVADDIDNRKESFMSFYNGLCRFIIGLSKKVLIADILAVPVNKIFALPDYELTVPLSWTGAFFFMLEIYFDFAGYSDMAIGIAQIFGFHFNENFRMPYTAQNITEFWRRWHISLSSFFRDYVYIPLGGNRKGTIRTYINLGVVFLLCGVWHGASWTFLIWGAYHGFFLIIERILKNKYNFMMKGVLGKLLTFIIVLAGWILFRCNTLEDAVSYFRAMLGLNSLADHLYYKYTYYINRETVFIAFAAFIFSVVRFERLKKEYYASDLKGFSCMILLILCMIYMSDASFNAFIYFQF